MDDKLVIFNEITRVFAPRSYQFTQYSFIFVSIYPTTTPQARYDTRSISKQSKAGLNSEFSFSYVKEQSLPYYLLITEKRTDGFMPFPRILTQN